MKKGKILLWIILILISVFSMATADDFRALPIDLSGGAPLQAKFDQNVTVYEDPTICVEYHLLLCDDHTERRVTAPDSRSG